MEEVETNIVKKEFYQSSECELTVEIEELLSKLLTAKMARELTNIASLTKLKQFLDTEIEPLARDGITQHNFTISKKCDIKYIRQIIKELGYVMTAYKEDSEKMYFNIKW